MSAQTAAVPQATPVIGVLRRLGWVVPVAVIAATAADLGLYHAAGVLFPEVTAWPGAGTTQIVGANLVYFLVGALTLLVVARVSRRPARHFIVLSGIGLVLSFALPLAAGLGNGSAVTPAAGMSTVVTLCLLHVGSYVVGVPMLIRLALNGKGG